MTLITHHGLQTPPPQGITLFAVRIDPHDSPKLTKARILSDAILLIPWIEECDKIDQLNFHKNIFHDILKSVLFHYFFRP